MSERRSWELTPREFLALKQHYDAHMFRWALERSDYRNAHRGKDSEPWLPGHFLGTLDRKPEMTVKDKLELQRINMSLAKIAPGAEPTEDIPAWAIGPKEELKAHG